MGITVTGWQDVILKELNALGIIAVPEPAGKYYLLKLTGSQQLYIHLVPIENNFVPGDLLLLQDTYRLQNIPLIHLWEDIWLTRSTQVMARITSMLGLNQTIHGRKTKVVAVTQAVADDFFTLNHLQGAAKSRYKYALIDAEGLIVAMASFSAKRTMTDRGAGHTSIELILFASAAGYTVQGGLSKLIKHLVKTVGPHDIMTYADLDWSYGKGYTKLGFQLDNQTEPAVIFLQHRTWKRCFKHRLPPAVHTAIDTLPEDEIAAYLKSSAYNRIFNTGNLKYILYL